MLPVVVGPAAVDVCDLVQVSNVLAGKDAGEDVADQAGDGVHDKGVEGVVDVAEEFDLGAEGDGGPNWDESCIRHSLVNCDLLRTAEEKGEKETHHSPA